MTNPDPALDWLLADAKSQGLTISEFGESGGPGMGGCPLGPTDQAAPRPGTASVVRSSDKKSVKVTWTAATAQPGAAPVTGYSIVAVASTAPASGERTQVGIRTGAPATQTTVAGLDPAQAYDYLGSEIVFNTAQTLVTYAPDATEPSPLLAAGLPDVSAADAEQAALSYAAISGRLA